MSSDIILSYGLSEDDERATVAQTVRARGSAEAAALDYVEANPDASLSAIERAIRSCVAVNDEGGCCPECGERTELHECESCGDMAWQVDCGHAGQPLAIVDGLCECCHGDELAAGDRVESGDTPDDYDTGRIIGVVNNRVEVAWDSGVRTTQMGYGGLRRIDY
jgi:hypothetical protein